LINISAIIPLYNGERFISDCINSLLQQTQPVREIIVIDDGSSDNGLSIVKNIRDIEKTRIKIIQNGSNRGSSYCRNIAISESAENYVLLIDQDDLINENFVKEISKIFKKSSEKEIVASYTSYFLISEDGSSTHQIIHDHIEPEDFIGHQFVRNRVLSNSGVVIKKSVFETIDLYDETLKFSQDWDLWLRIAKAGFFSCLYKPLTSIRRHTKNTSSKIEGFLDDEKRILKKFDLNFIKKCILGRHLPEYTNKIDFLSILLRLNNLSLLIRELRELNILYPNNFDHHFFFGFLHHSKEDYTQALKSFEKVTKDSKYYYSAQNNLASMLLIKGKLDLAEKILQSVTEQRPDYQDAKHNLKISQSRIIDYKKLNLTYRPLRNTLYQYA
jgi:glycosyltransferase involved in cell wall biosynthesis